MSEKRFEKSKSDITDYRIYDYEKEDAYFIDCDDESTVDAIVDLMNQQQITICKLQDLCGESDSENAKLRIKNNELQATISLLQTELELTANTKLFSRKELERKVEEQQAEIERLQKIIDLTSYQLKVQDRIIQEMEEKE